MENKIRSVGMHTIPVIEKDEGCLLCIFPDITDVTINGICSTCMTKCMMVALRNDDGEMSIERTINDGIEKMFGLLHDLLLVELAQLPNPSNARYFERSQQILSMKADMLNNWREYVAKSDLKLFTPNGVNGTFEEV